MNETRTKSISEEERVAAWNALPKEQQLKILRDTLGIQEPYDHRSFKAGYKKAYEEMRNFIEASGVT